MKGLRVLVGISGGVDSAVAAFSLIKQGYYVESCTMLMFGDELANSKLINDARMVADRLKIKHHILDCREKFYKTVISNFISEYSSGRTPNPCVVCNKNIKFGLFLDYARSMNFDYISTGHYAQVCYDDVNKEYLLKKARFENKDQSYFLYNLNQEILNHILFPLYKYEKSELKKIAAENKLVLETKKESQDICFIPDGDYIAFLEMVTKKKSISGNFVDQDGNIYGRHNGIWNYTIGQRKGLGVSFNQKMFVTDINADNNTVVLSNKDPFSNILKVKNINIISPKIFEDEMIVDVKIRYKHKAKPAKIKINTEKDNIKNIDIKNIDNIKNITVTFQEPQRAITRGQSAVFYKNDIVIGGGIIE